MKASVLFITLALLSVFSCAKTPFEQHFQAVGQSMAAFYMFELSQGDERYLDQFEQHKAQASSVLEAQSASENKVFLKRWQLLVPKLHYKTVKGMGLSFDRVIREEFRNYLAGLYAAFKLQPKQQSHVLTMMTRVSLLNTLLSARALDMASSMYNHGDSPFDQKRVALQIEKDLQALTKAGLPLKQLASLRKVKNKFKFMKKSLIDYQSRTAYFLLYSNINSIKKLMAVEYGGEGEGVANN